MPIVDLPAEDEMAAAVSCIDAWVERELASGGLLVAAERQDVTDRTASQRFLYYHFNPGTEPPRRVLVKATNNAATPAVVHVIAALAGPGTGAQKAASATP